MNSSVVVAVGPVGLCVEYFDGWIFMSYICGTSPPIHTRTSTSWKLWTAIGSEYPALLSIFSSSAGRASSPGTFHFFIPHTALRLY